MKILFSAFACEPHRGSEEGVGWNIPWAVSQGHDVHVLTTPRHRGAIEKYLAAHPNPRLSFSYHDIPAGLLRQVGTSELWQIYYYVWQRRIATWARDIIRRFDPAVIHHITYVRYWAPSSLWQAGRPFIFGPVGGAEDTPRPFLKTFSFSARCKEKARRWARLIGERDPAVRATYAHTAIALANTRETAARMSQLGAGRIRVMGESALAEAELGAAPVGGSEVPGGIRFLVAARLLHWKGVHLAIRGFARCASPSATMDILGAGPERECLSALAAELGASERVRFHGLVPRAEALRLLRGSRALVHASLHDSGGWVCLEAMAAGVPVICLKLGGPATQVTADTGFLVDATAPDQVVVDLGAAMERLANEPALAAAMGEAGRRHARKHFTWEKKAEQFEELYRTLV